MKEEYIPDLGKVHFTKRKLAKRITIRYDPKGKIKVSLPKNVSYKACFNYITSKKSVIKNKIEVLQERQNQVDYSDFQTKWHKVVLNPEDRADIAFRIRHDETIIRYPYDKDSKDPVLQSAIRKGIEETLRTEAKAYLPERISKLAKAHNLSFNNVYIKNVKTLWGSCSSKNNINLNIHLMRLPDHLIDYVLLHELCHTIHKNHSSKFWEMLEQITDDEVINLKRELRRYFPRLY